MINDFRAIYMPYCLKRQSDGLYVVLNRGYKPIGFYTDKHVNYEDYPICVKLKITAALAKKLSHKASDDLETIFLYDDGCVPIRNAANMNNYFKKLALLAKLRVKEK